MSAEDSRQGHRKGTISEEANTLDRRQAWSDLPAGSTKTQISDVARRRVGMDIVKTNIQKLNGSIEIRSEPGRVLSSSSPAADAGYQMPTKLSMPLLTIPTKLGLLR